MRLFSFFRKQNDTHGEDDHAPFLRSLKNVTHEDIPLSREPDRFSRGEKVKNIIRSVLVGICAVVCAGSCLYLIDNFIQKARATSLYDEAAAEFEAAGLDFGFGTGTKDTSAQTDGASLMKDDAQQSLPSLSATIERIESAEEDVAVTEEKTYNEEMEKLRALLGNYKERNEDVCGYISIPAVDINYVVVQGEDNEFYLNHNYKGEPLVVGSIYMDYRNSENLSENYNTILYGHNIETPGIMFHGVIDFFDKDIFDNEYIYLYTMDGVYVYKPFSIYATQANSGYIRTSFPTATDFASFCTEMQSRSQLASDVTFDGDEHILTLSTCTNYNYLRYAFHAYLVDYIH